MNMNNLTAEMLLARFFDTSVLSAYSINIIGKSGKGSSATLAARIAKEWSKDDFQPSGSSKRKRGNNSNEDDGRKLRKISNAEEIASSTKDEVADLDDWKRPLFYWKGRLLHDKSKNVLQWNGSWVSGLAEDGLPENKEYDETKHNNAFTLKSVEKLKAVASNLDTQKESSTTCHDALTISLQPLIGQSGKFKGKYLLDQGDGLGPSDFRDLSHHFVFDSKVRSSTILDGAKHIIVVGWGSTEFGNFVSAGYIHRNPIEDSESYEMVFARRYIADDDSRQEVVRKGKAEILFKEFEDEDGSSFWTQMLPWK
mmetsp:Transcript_667/g.796  ORF Transcript_667/g.796 Transcript_667/m.796 type:complete len:311 (-) Transcript_667:87-1019(-)